MAKLGQYTYPDIRFGDAVEISGRVLQKFKGTVSVKGLAWELGMAEGSGTLFAKVAAMRDFGLIEGRGELRVSPLGQRVLHPANADEGHSARAEAFERVELLRQLYARFEGEVPDDMSMLVGLEEITRAARDEIVRRAPLILKHLTDAIRVLGRPVKEERKPDTSRQEQNKQIDVGLNNGQAGLNPASKGIDLVAAGRHLSVPLTPQYIDVAINMLSALKSELAGEANEDGDADDDHPIPTQVSGIEHLELGSMDQLGHFEETA